MAETVALPQTDPYQPAVKKHSTLKRPASLVRPMHPDRQRPIVPERLFRQPTVQTRLVSRQREAEAHHLIARGRQSSKQQADKPLAVELRLEIRRHRTGRRLPNCQE